MGKGSKKKSNALDESWLVLPPHPLVNVNGTGDETGAVTATTTIVDTHTHLLSTFSAYKSKYPGGKFGDVFEFVKGVYRASSPFEGDNSGAVKEGEEGSNVKSTVTTASPIEALIDVYCEAPVQKEWKNLADSAVDRGIWGDIGYWFVMGVHPHESKSYTDEVEADILEAMTHPRCVGWGEIGLDYHYDLSVRDIQRGVFKRQLEHAVRLGKPLTIHTREAEEDTEAILKEVVPKDHKIHVHCFTDTPDFAERLLDHFPNLFIGVTGVITYSSNLNTVEIVRRLARSRRAQSESSSSGADGWLRIVLETDAPYMVPGNIYKSLGLKSGSRLPLCHTGMIPWTAEFVAGVIQEGGDTDYDAARVMREARENARFMYGV